MHKNYLKNPSSTANSLSHFKILKILTQVKWLAYVYIEVLLK